MVTHELRSNSIGAASTTSNRHEFHMNDVIYERPGGCFITYRMIAFAFVFVLAVLIAAAFLAVWFSEEPEKTVSINVYICFLYFFLCYFLNNFFFLFVWQTTDPLTKLATEEYQEDKYALSKGIAPKLYRLELEPIETLNAGKVRFKGHVVIEFSNSIAPEDVDNVQSKRLVLNSKHLEIHTVKLVSVDVPLPEEDEEHGARRNRRDVQIGKYYTFFFISFWWELFCIAKIVEYIIICSYRKFLLYRVTYIYFLNHARMNILLFSKSITWLIL